MSRSQWGQSRREVGSGTGRKNCRLFLARRGEVLGLGYSSQLMMFHRALEPAERKRQCQPWHPSPRRQRKCAGGAHVHRAALVRQEPGPWGNEKTALCDSPVPPPRPAAFGCVICTLHEGTCQGTSGAETQPRWFKGQQRPSLRLGLAAHGLSTSVHEVASPPDPEGVLSRPCLL